jgi:hypothetical protein
MPNNITRAALVTLVVGLGLGLSACTESRLHLSDDFGSAVRQDLVAQIADPDATYRGLPVPGGSGERVALAQRRYVTGKVIPPMATTTSSISLGGSGSAALGQ